MKSNPASTGMEKQNEEPADITHSQVACIGAGFSGIGVAANLYRWYGITDVQLFERREALGGTWYANTYPGKHLAWLIALRS